MPSSVIINESPSICLHQEDFYDIFEYVRNFIDSPDLEFTVYLAVDSGMDAVDFRKLTSSEFNTMYKAILNALNHFKGSGKSFRHNNRALKEWEKIIPELEKDERFEPS